MKRKIVKRYRNEDLTVVWKPDLCIHSTNCFNALPKVFDPKRRPWVDPEVAPSDEIRRAIDNCPSRALSYELNEKSAEDSSTRDDNAGVEIKMTQNGPLIITGKMTLLDPEGNRIETGDRAALCRCGASKNKPFCDGSHNDTGFNG